jgi:hypothetical protein
VNRFVAQFVLGEQHVGQKPKASRIGDEVR